jgi:hypothetical protein
VTHHELNELPSLAWMPSRIPVRDALVAFVPDNVAPPDAPFSTGEIRWYPLPSGGLRMVVPYDGQPYIAPALHLEKGFWDHTTCDSCTARIEAMELCYVTSPGQEYDALCLACYKTYVVSKLGAVRALLWHAKRLVRMHAAA